MEIIDYPNYLIYPDGRVQNKKTKRYRKPNINTRYLFVNLCKNGKKKNFYIHRLIAIHYIPNPENKLYVNHIDGNKLNNSIGNLEWCTNIENCNAFKSKQSNNKTGIVNISYIKRDELWEYQKTYFGNNFRKCNENKQIVLWIKFYDYLMLKCI